MKESEYIELLWDIENFCFYIESEQETTSLNKVKNKIAKLNTYTEKIYDKHKYKIKSLLYRLQNIMVEDEFIKEEE